MKVLICTIVRNAELTIPRWWKQITAITETYPHIEFSLSVYENDSIDNSKNLLKTVMKDSNKYFTNSFLGLEDIKTDFYQSVVSNKRVENLAKARNNCFDQVSDLTIYDYAMSVEVDAHFTVSSLKLLFDNLKDWDILSAGSYVPPTEYDYKLASAKGESVKLTFYDLWATRLTDKEDMWNNEIKPDVPLFTSPLSSLNPKDLTTKINDIIPVYSTFNLVCLYRMKPILEGCRFSGYSNHLQSFDCDTTVICENFHKSGYNRIGLMPHVEIFNDPYHNIQPKVMTSEPKVENCCG